MKALQTQLDAATKEKVAEREKLKTALRKASEDVTKKTQALNTANAEAKIKAEMIATLNKAVGLICRQPSFVFESIVGNYTVIKMKAVPSGTFQLTVTYAHPGGGKIKINDGVSDKFLIDEEGVSVSLLVERDELIASRGYVRVEYSYTGKDSPCYRIHDTALVPLLEPHKISFDLGSVFSLANKGDWKSSLEWAVSAESVWYAWLTTIASLRYSSVTADGKNTASASSNTAQSANSTSSSTTATQANAPEEAAPNPFLGSGGVLSWDGFFVLNNPCCKKDGAASSWINRSACDSLGLLLGAGFTSLPNEDITPNVRVGFKKYLGVSLTVSGYNIMHTEDKMFNSSSYFRGGLLWNDIWSKASAGQTERYFIDAEAVIPYISIASKYIRLRFYADVPRNGDGPSDIRVSALLKFDPTDLIPKSSANGSATH